MFSILLLFAALTYPINAQPIPIPKPQESEDCPPDLYAKAKTYQEVRDEDFFAPAPPGATLPAPELTLDYRLDGNSHLRDLRFLYCFPQLVELHIWGDLDRKETVRLVPLKPLRHLRKVELDYVEISEDARELKGLYDLTTFSATHLHGAKVFSGLLTSPGLTFIKLFELHGAVNLEALGDLPHLDELWIRDSKFDDLGKLANGMGSLRRIRAEGGWEGNGNYINATVSSLKHLHRLDSLELIRIPIQNANFVSEVERIRSLRLSSTQLTNIPRLKPSEFDEVRINGSHVRDLEPLAGKTIKKLSLLGNRIDDLTLISEIKGLERLELAGNCIRDVTPLIHLPKWVYVDLQDNPIAIPSANPDQIKTYLRHLRVSVGRVAEKNKCAREG